MYTNWRPRGGARVLLFFFGRLTALRFLALGLFRVRLLAGARGMLCMRMSDVYTYTRRVSHVLFSTLLVGRNKITATHGARVKSPTYDADHACATDATTMHQQQSEPWNAHAASHSNLAFSFNKTYLSQHSDGNTGLYSVQGSGTMGDSGGTREGHRFGHVI
tara:strand:- start:458 stop:943 length:486 start_codon:yes stop_codon:yes gene_type:complete